MEAAAEAAVGLLITSPAAAPAPPGRARVQQVSPPGLMGIDELA